MTKLDRPLRREITIDGQPYTVVVSAAGVVLTKKRARNGVTVSWRDALDVAAVKAAMLGKPDA